jgi:hypothetical protein
MVNLKAKPFFLSDEDIDWVETILAPRTRGFSKTCCTRSSPVG